MGAICPRKKQIRLVCISLAAMFSLPGCARNYQVNSSCQWPHETPVRLDLTNRSQQRHLSDDAQFAEDLAIRYADSQPGSVSDPKYPADRERCMAKLFEQIGSIHGVNEEQVRTALTHRRTSMDLAVVLSFFGLYGLASYHIARRIWQHFPPADGWVPGSALVAVMSFAASIAGLLLGELWSANIEMIRVGNGHMSYRANRIPWNQHEPLLLVGLWGLFLLLSAIAYRRVPHNTENRRDRLTLGLST